jgi:hypothetical protein
MYVILSQLSHEQKVFRNLLALTAIQIEIQNDIPEITKGEHH